MSRFFPVLLLVGLANVEAASSTTPASATCGDMKTFYRDHACCGMPEKETGYQIVPDPKFNLALSANPCAGKKPAPNSGFDNVDCFVNGAVSALEQAGGDVTEGYVGGLATTRLPITDNYWRKGLCPVNVHWHLGAEHRSQGEFDENGSGPLKAGTPSATNPNAGGRRLADVRYGYACHKYDANDPKFTTPYKWKHCVGMYVGETYEVHWPHSAIGACHTPHQFQTPFYDGVFCGWTAAVATLVGNDAQNLVDAVGVQAQVFTIVNDESYYYPDLMRGAIVDGQMWYDVAAYTGSTTGTTRNNEVCSKYTPITWQVDRKCHLISASTFDKMCADMKQQPDDMSDDLHAHGARELVKTALTANNLAEAPGGNGGNPR
jgi:hypothetical protein